MRKNRTSLRGPVRLGSQPNDLDFIVQGAVLNALLTLVLFLQALQALRSTRSHYLQHHFQLPGAQKKRG